MLSKSTIRYIQSLQHKKFRDAEGVFVAEGPKLVKELLEGNVFVCKAIFALPDWEASMPAHLKSTPTYTVESIKDFELEKISSLSTANQVLAVFEKKAADPAPNLRHKVTLVLDDIQDPGNLGTIIRIADWFGIENIICSPHTADMYNGKVVQSTMASLQRVNLIYTDIESFLLQNGDIPVFAATLHGEPLSSVSHLKEGVIVIGNESKGIGESILKMPHTKITIPRIGDAESLNAAVAAGIILYESTRG